MSITLYGPKPIVPEVDIIKIIPLTCKRKDMFEQLGIIVQTIVGVTLLLTYDVKIWKMFSLMLVLDYRNIDRGPAACFLRAIDHTIKEPVRLFG